MYLEALAKDFLVRGADGEVIILEDGQSKAFKYAMVDLLKPAAWAWYRDHIRCEVLLACDDGGEALVAGWMQDFAEYLPGGARVAGGGKATDVHNLYPMLAASAARGALEGREAEATFFTRSGSLRTPRYAPMTWVPGAPEEL